MTSEYKIVVARSSSRGQEDKWEKNFQYLFSMLLTQLLGAKPKITCINEQSTDAEQQIDEAAILLLLLKEESASHHQLLALCERFYQRVHEKNHFCISGRYTFFKVKQNLANTPNRLNFASQVPAYEFCDIDKLTGKPRTFDPRIGSPQQHAYWFKLSDVCYDVAFLLKDFAKKRNTQFPKERTIYMATVGRDMVLIRDILRRELIQRGYRVLPERNLPLSTSHIEAATKEDLQQCVLSIHLIGEDYGKLVTDEEYSAAYFQDKIAHEYALTVKKSREQNPKELSFRRLIWVDPHVESLTENQQVFIENLRNEAATIEEAEVMEIPFGEFRFIVLENLQKVLPIRTSNPLTTEKSKGNSVYLMYDQADHDAVTALASVLIDEGLEVLALSNEGAPSELRYEHQEHLRKCDASIIYIKEANEQWFNAKLQDLFKSPAFGRTHPIRVKAVFSARKNPFDLRSLKEYITVINGEEAPSGLSLRPFFEQLNRVS